MPGYARSLVITRTGAFQSPWAVCPALLVPCTSPKSPITKSLVRSAKARALAGLAGAWSDDAAPRLPRRRQHLRLITHKKPHPNGKKMHWIDGFKNQALPWSVILPVSAGLWLTITRSTFSKQRQNSRVIALTSEEAGGLEMTAWNVPLRESLPGPSKKPFKGLLGSPGAPLATPEVYGLGSEKT